MAFLLPIFSSTKYEPKRAPSGFDRANFCSRWTYMFILPLLERGARTPLQDKDLDHLSKDHCMPELVDRLEARWDIELRKKQPSLRWAFCHLLRTEVIIGGIFTFLLSVTRISQAVLLGVIISWMTLWSRKTETQHTNATYTNAAGNVTAHSLVNMTTALNTDQKESVTVGFVAAFALIAVAIAQIWFHHAMYYYGMTSGWMGRLAAIGLVQRKLLRVDTNVLTQESHGKIVNLVSNDVARFDMFSKSVHFGWAALLDLVVITLLIGNRVGALATVAGVGPVVLSLPLQMYFGKRFAIQRKKTAQYTVKRVHLTGEVLTGIITVKSSVWEESFRKMISGFRASERRSIFVALTLKAINHALEFATPYISTASTFLVFWATDNTLDISTVFSTMALIHVLRVSIGKHLTRFLESLPECLVSISRLRDFLLLPERPVSPAHVDPPIFKDRPKPSARTLMYLDSAVFSRRTDVGHYRPRKGIPFTETAEERARHWDSVAATTVTRAPSMPAPVLLQELIQDVDMWRFFVVEFIFGGRSRIKSIRRIVNRGSCEHIILSRGFTTDIGQALYAAGLHTCFSCIVDTEGNYLWPRASFDPDQYGPSCFGDLNLISAAFELNTGLEFSYGKDLLLANQMKKRWEQVLPHWSKSNAGKAPHLVYIDDNPEIESLPRRNVKVVQLPPEIMHGFTSLAGCAALSAINFDTLGPECVVVWDFDCTISSVHLHKTLNMVQTPIWLTRWGPPLLQWWAAHVERVKNGQRPTDAKSRTNKIYQQTDARRNAKAGSNSEPNTETPTVTGSTKSANAGSNSEPSTETPTVTSSTKSADAGSNSEPSTETPTVTDSTKSADAGSNSEPSTQTPSVTGSTKSADAGSNSEPSTETPTVTSSTKSADAGSNSNLTTETPTVTGSTKSADAGSNSEPSTETPTVTGSTKSADAGSNSEPSIETPTVTGSTKSADAGSNSEPSTETPSVTGSTKSADAGSNSELGTESRPFKARTCSSQPAACLSAKLVEDANTTSSSERQVLECGPISLKASEGDLVVVTGDTGTGKSTLLHCFMQELRLKTGSIVMMTNSVGYCGQQPWIMAGTLRENIVWGAQFDSRRYGHVLTACALRTDIEQLADGDLTEIGERGVNLSGGQKARVALARVMYAQPQLCFLDDPLAALDPRVGAHIMRHAVQSMQRAGVCVVLATHHVHIKNHANVVIHMELNADGDTCRVSRIDRNANPSPMNAGNSVSPPTSMKPACSDVRSPVTRAVTTLPSIPGFNPSSFFVLAGAFANDQKLETSETKRDIVSSKSLTDNRSKARQKPLKLVEAEERTLGSVEGETYHGYAKAAGYFWCVVVVLLFAGSQAVAISADFWLKQWSDADDQKQELYPIVFAVLTVSVVILSFTRGIIFFNTALRAATNLHDQAYDAVVGSPLSFFTANPVGRILNKFSSDLGQVDEELPKVLFECFDALALCLGSMLLCVIAVPWVLLALIPLGIGMIYVRRHFLFSARELKRMESSTKSPIFSVVQEQLTGLINIRVFGKQQQLIRSFSKVLATYGRTWFTWLMVNRWVGFCLDMLTTSMLASTVLLSVILVAADTGVDVGTIAIAMTYAIQLSGMFQYMVRLSAQVETLMTSAERLIYYTMLEQEENVSDGGTLAKPPQGWPSKGELVIRNLSVRYRSSLPLVLRSITASISPGARVGIIGRTGSGKTSLSLALMRLNQIEGGSILLDGVEVQHLPLKQCREAVGYIPQEPILFGASLRFNLDPSQTHSDEELLEALEAVKIKEKFQAQCRGLDTMITESGRNLSVGERQCISLARALLQKATVYVLDEATANIDYEHDDNIQQTLRDHPAFAESTLIIIAHRLNTIRDADRVIMLDDGQVVQVGTPDELLANEVDGSLQLVNDKVEASSSVTNDQTDS